MRKLSAPITRRKRKTPSDDLIEAPGPNSKKRKKDYSNELNTAGAPVGVNNSGYPHHLPFQHLPTYDFVRDHSQFWFNPQQYHGANARHRIWEITEIAKGMITCAFDRAQKNSSNFVLTRQKNPPRSTSSSSPSLPGSNPSSSSSNSIPTSFTTLSNIGNEGIYAAAAFTSCLFGTTAPLALAGIIVGAKKITEAYQKWRGTAEPQQDYEIECELQKLSSRIWSRVNDLGVLANVSHEVATWVVIVFNLPLLQMKDEGIRIFMDAILTRMFADLMENSQGSSKDTKNSTFEIQQRIQGARYFDNGSKMFKNATSAELVASALSHLIVDRTEESSHYNNLPSVHGITLNFVDIMTKSGAIDHKGRLFYRENGNADEIGFIFLPFEATILEFLGFHPCSNNEGSKSQAAFDEAFKQANTGMFSKLWNQKPPATITLPASPPSNSNVNNVIQSDLSSWLKWIQEVWGKLWQNRTNG